MKIIAGRHRGRAIDSPNGENTRPTSARAREAIFNVLTHGIDDFDIQNTVVADIFAGTGGLGFEALSRGANHCIFSEKDAHSIKVIQSNGGKLHETDRLTVIKSDARKLPTFPIKMPERCGLFFLDPPYNQELIKPTLNSLKNQNWLQTNSIGVVECGKDENLNLPSEFKVISTRNYGAARITFIRFITD